LIFLPTPPGTSSIRCHEFSCPIGADFPAMTEAMVSIARCNPIKLFPLLLTFPPSVAAPDYLFTIRSSPGGGAPASKTGPWTKFFFLFSRSEVSYLLFLILKCFLFPMGPRFPSQPATPPPRTPLNPDITVILSNPAPGLGLRGLPHPPPALIPSCRALFFFTVRSSFLARAPRCCLVRLKTLTTPDSIGALRDNQTILQCPTTVGWVCLSVNFPNRSFFLHLKRSCPTTPTTGWAAGGPVRLLELVFFIRV